MEGSSPLARGLQRLLELDVRVRGIIPARAGFTSLRRPPRKRHPDHPRSRGVYSGESSLPRLLTGSSPLARGLHHQLRHRQAADRIIPARAGFTTETRGAPPRRPDHPRSRGVYSQPGASLPTLSGSSPLARGLPADSHRQPVRPGIIPARAGFTHARRPFNRGHAGSSPLARGLHALGKLSQSLGVDHPRSRGVYRTTYTKRTVSLGSSPLARGLHLAIGVIPTVGHPTRGRSPSLVT